MFRPIVIAGIALSAGPAIAAQNETQSTSRSSGLSDLAAIVDTEFPAYDTDSSGMLEQPEFSKWMIALKDEEIKATGKTIPATEVTAWANGAFVSADADRSDAVSKPELITYLSGGAA